MQRTNYILNVKQKRPDTKSAGDRLAEILQSWRIFSQAYYVDFPHILVARINPLQRALLEKGLFQKCHYEL